MIFSSFAFLFGLLPVTLAGYHLCRTRDWAVAAKLVLVASSLLFYAWSGLHFLPLVLASVGVNYAIGAAMHARRAIARPLFCAGIVFNLGLLGYFKYATFFSANVAALFGQSFFARSFFAQAVILPLAISFFTFQQVAYLTETHRGEAPAGSLLDYALFILFFPHLIAGPITHHTEMLPQFAHAGRGRFDGGFVLTGVSILILGLAKKTLLADTLATVADPVFAAAGHGDALGAADAWAGALAYTFQLYFDFSGYSDMAIGLGLLFGIRFPVNFASPYQAASIIEFWRRWHITLSRFLRNYLYIPLGGNRQGWLRRHVNLMLTMVLGGLWHGAGWTFVIWGALHGGCLIINHLWRAGFGTAARPAARFAAWALTFLVVTVGWVFFRAASASAAMAMLAAMAGLTRGAPADDGAVIAAGLILAAAGIAFMAPNTLALAGYSPDVATPLCPAPRWRLPPGITAAALGVTAALCFGRLPNPGVFLYFNF